jgi:hypothetical protein
VIANESTRESKDCAAEIITSVFNDITAYLDAGPNLINRAAAQMYKVLK